MNGGSEDRRDASLMSDWRVCGRGFEGRINGPPNGWGLVVMLSTEDSLRNESHSSLSSS